MTFDSERALTRGQEVLRLEAAALHELRDAIGDDFIEACSRILQCSGRVVVAGMGKAGIVGQKISATLASTGTPSLFLHPAEALHGDLGRLRPEDLLLALSHSGETRELVQMVPAAKAIGVKVLAICASAGSKLGTNADLTLALGDAPEACPLGLAPTVSTTRMLALGDALAMSVLEGRDFTREEFAAFHPAGSLGKSLMRIRDIMRKGEELPTLLQGSTLADALAVMTETKGRPGAAVVLDTNRALVGIFTDGDLRRLALQGNLPLADAIDDHMAAKPSFLIDSHLVGEALHVFKTTHVDQMPVLAEDSQEVVGLVDVQDLLEVRL